jgi:F-type H+-transporting ATPase subunit gamma
MPSLIDLRRRIRSVRNTQQITKAMKMVSAAKLRRAQERVLAARPYAAMLREILSNVAAAVSLEDDSPAAALLTVRPENRILFILLTSDRGLAGAFNSNLIKAAQRFLEERAGRQVELELLGRKGRDFFQRRKALISGEHLGLFDRPSYAQTAEIAQRIIERVRREEIDAVYLLYNEFKTVLQQKLTVTKILPVETPQDADQVDYIFEQPASELLASLLPRYVEVQLFQAVLESAAAEHAARMTAMDAATSNAADVIERLTLYMNRVRQASITKEIIEVVSGAAALE